ncbi:hypothetical protein BKI51_05135 [Alphaproteobacteria bacterium AO1-B]|nr:hypothetical protein BKI51_05135 [Alphaproteobacteria bacterium AO1-B]
MTFRADLSRAVSMGRLAPADAAADAKDVAAGEAGADGDAAAGADADGGALVRGVPMVGSVLGKEATGIQDQGNEPVSCEQRCGALAGLAVLVEPKIGTGVLRQS